MTAHNLTEHLARDAGMARYAAHAKRLLRYQRYLEAALPLTLRPHVRVANLKADKLVLYASNSAVASKLRQIAPRLGGIFASEGVKLTEIDIRTQADTPPATVKKLNPAKHLPGLHQQNALASLVDTLDESSPLRVSLQRLLRSIRAR